MRHFIPLVAFAVCALAAGPGAFADSQPRGKHEPRVEPSRFGKASVYVGRKAVWRAKSRHTKIITAVRWSRSRDAVAFATRTRRGAVTVKVVLLRGHARGHALSWPVPHRLGNVRKRASVTWIGKRKVAFGRSAVRPDLVASWRLPK